jgi:hypothetical protein
VNGARAVAVTVVIEEAMVKACSGRIESLQ